MRPELSTEVELPPNVSEDDIEDGYVEEDIENVEDVVPNKGYTKENHNTGTTKEKILHIQPQEKMVNREVIFLSNIISTIRNSSEYMANILTKTLYNFFVNEQKNCRVITAVTKDYQKGQASLFFSTHCENNDGVTINTVDEQICQLKLSQATCTSEDYEIEEDMVCPGLPPKYYDFSKGEKIVSIIVGSLSFLVIPVYLILYIRGDLSVNSEEELRDCFLKYEKSLKMRQ